MKKYLPILIVALFLTACSTQTTKQISQKEADCVDSGGTFSDNKCTCPDGTYEFDGVDVPLYNYEESTGLCIDPMGTPGGKKGEEIKALHSQKMESNKASSE